MKKLKILLALLSILVVAAKAQQKPINQSVDDKGNFIRYSASSFGPGLGLTIGIDKNTKWIEYHNTVANQPNSNYVFLKGTKTITVFGYIPKDSADYYRFNIIEDNQSLETNAIPFIKGAKPIRKNVVEINLGTYNIENKKLIIETYKVTAPRQIKTVTIYNKEIEPAQIMWVTRAATTKKGSSVTMDPSQDGFKFKINDSVLVNSLHVVLKPTDIPFIYHAYLKNLATGQKDLISNNWSYSYYSHMDGSTLPHMVVNASFFNEPGDYEVQIVPTLPGGFRIKSLPEKTTTFRFTILPSDPVLQQKTVIKYVAIGLVVIACLVFIIFYTIRTRNKKLLAEQKQQKDMAQLQLDAVRSQLNPHFLFNALAGIQNLMNKTDIDQANRYLTKFARLTRNVLNNKDLINLSEEKALLDDYLQMEQMRFGFNFEIAVDPTLDISNIQIPSMLLHHFVENAVKHGLPSDERTGKITISISKKDNDLELTIADNGKGNQNDGLGLQLSKKRIDLLNTIYKDSPIQLDVQSGASGTVITITLKHWL
jgi:hypothetical protein